MGQPVYTQADCAFYNDGTEAGSTLISGTNIIVGNTGAEDKSFDTTILIRAVVQIADKSESNNFDIRVQKNGTGGYDTRANITGITAVDSANLTQGDDCTQRLGGGTFISNNNGVGDNTTTNSASLTAGQELEVLFAFEIDEADVSDGDYFDFRVYQDGGSTAFDTYSETLRVTVDKLAAAVNQRSFRIRTADSAGPDTTTDLAAAGSDQNIGYGVTFRIMFELDETNDVTILQAYELRYQKNGSGGYLAMVGTPFQNATAYPVIWGVESSQYAHGASITSNHVGQSAKTFTNGHAVEDTSGDVESNSLGLKNQATCLEYCIRIPRSMMVLTTTSLPITLTSGCTLLLVWRWIVMWILPG